MAHELQISYQGTATLYAIIRRHDDAQVWNLTNNIFETWSDSMLANYDIPLTDAGGDLFQGDWPAGITPGQYRVLYYRQTGSTPVTSDLLLGTADVYWNGQTTTSQSSVNLLPEALTDLASVKRYLRLTDGSDDSLLTELINQTTRRIERICGRQFKWRSYRERHHVRNGRVVLKHFPIVQLHRVSTGAAGAMTVQYTGNAIRADVQVNDEAVTLRSINASGTVSTHELDFQTYPTVSTLVAAADAQTDWVATLTHDAPSADLHPTGAMDTRQRTIWLTYPDQDQAANDLDISTGTLQLYTPGSAPGSHPGSYPGNFPESFSGHCFGSFFAPVSGGTGKVFGDSAGGFFGGTGTWFGPVLVEYDAGFSVIPEDVALVCNELVAQAYHLGRRDTSVHREQLGDYTYALSGLASLSEAQLARLRPYMSIALGGR